MEEVLEAVDVFERGDIIFKSIHNIDLDQNKVIVRAIPEYFNSYIDSLIEFINSNKRVRNYKPRSQSTQVITNIRTIIESMQEDVRDEELITLNNYEIAERLLIEEAKKQENINRLGNNIKKGSIIQVILKKEDIYKYLIAKVDFAEWIDNDDFATKIGFSAKSKDIGKTCLLEITEEGALLVESAKIYLDNEAKYWADNFLELREMMSDEVNTETVFKEVEKVLKSTIKKKSPSDYTVISNSLIGKLKTSTHIDYNIMVKDLLENYSPEDSVNLTREYVDKTIEKLNKLPEEKNFDLQFKPAPNVIKAKISKRYNVTTGIEIKVADYIPEIRNVIKSIEDNDGTRYLKIKTTDNDTFNLFD